MKSCKNQIPEPGYRSVPLNDSTEFYRAYKKLGYDPRPMNSQSLYYVIEDNAGDICCLFEVVNNKIEFLLLHNHLMSNLEFELFLLTELKKIGVQNISNYYFSQLNILIIPEPLIDYVQKNCKKIKLRSEFGLFFIFLYDGKIEIKNKNVTVKNDELLKFLITACITQKELSPNNEKAIIDTLKAGSKDVILSEKNNYKSRVYRSILWKLRNYFELDTETLLAMFKTHPSLPWNSSEIKPLVIEHFSEIERTVKDLHPQRYTKLYQNIVSNSLLDKLPIPCVKQLLDNKKIDYSFVINNFEFSYVEKENTQLAQLFKKYISL